MSDPIVLVDYEFHYSSGAIDVVEVEEGKATVTYDDDAITIYRNLEPQTIEQTIVNRKRLDFYRKTRRVVEQ